MLSKHWQKLIYYVIGSKRVFNRNLAAGLPRELCSKAYKKNQARLPRKGIY